MLYSAVAGSTPAIAQPRSPARRGGGGGGGGGGVGQTEPAGSVDPSGQVTGGGGGGGGGVGQTEPAGTVVPSAQVIGAGGGVLVAQAERPTVAATVVAARMSVSLIFFSFFTRAPLANEHRRSNVPSSGSGLLQEPPLRCSLDCPNCHSIFI
jgi:hypothetical protein